MVRPPVPPHPYAMSTWPRGLQIFVVTAAAVAAAVAMAIITALVVLSGTHS